MTRRPNPRGRARFIKLPAGWRSTRRSGSILYDAFLPALLLLLVLFTLGLIVFAAGILLGIISYK